MPELSDSAIFHRLWSLLGLHDPEILSRLKDAEIESLAIFLQKFDSLPWEPLTDNPHISQLRDNDLSPITPLGKSLYDQLIRRQKISLWKRLMFKLQGW